MLNLKKKKNQHQICVCEMFLFVSENDEWVPKNLKSEEPRNQELGPVLKLGPKRQPWLVVKSCQKSPEKWPSRKTLVTLILRAKGQGRKELGSGRLDVCPSAGVK